MNRLTIACFFCVCLFLLVVLMGIFTIRDDNSTLVQPSHKNTVNDVLKEKQQTSEASLLLNERLQQASLENGRKIFSRCALCHNSSKHNEVRRVGPTLWEIVNRPLATATGFSYSRALRANFDKKWDFMTLDRFLHSPRKAFPGTIMSFAGIKNDQDRADLLLYLRSLSDHPVSLPMNNKEEDLN
ncbi:c-type cytochrome [Bartonella sp. CB189]|uniref:c-type cytochrome n=1 Tax=Bartonella sp. CB189 TaxID=3112254 RepID=UPI002F96A098